MDSFAAVILPRDDAAEKLKFESFRLGKGLPSSMASRRHSSHARSHSRNTSISSVASLPVSTSSGSLASSASSTDSSSLTLSTSTSNSSVSSSKRNSHHRRRSSVSTRHESAEMMGVSIPDLPPSKSDDHFTLGEKDSIRRRALWALEGKQDMAFSKVEIPELSTPDLEKKSFDFSAKSSGNSGFSGSFSAQSLSSLLGNKRDSFKLLAASSSSKDQLHTLVEEEEEDEEKQPEPFQEHTPPPESPDVPASVPSVAVTKPSPARPRPSTLNLRPLSLTPESLASLSNGLPTPSMTPSPRSGLKTLALTTSFLPSPTDESPAPLPTAMKRQSLILTPSPTPPLPRRFPVNVCDSPASSHSSGPEEDTKLTRRRSIGYRSSSTSSTSSIVPGLPTPEYTPTSDRRYSIASSASDESSMSRPLSVSEQHFLFKQHNALLARITDLERALSSRERSTSRPVSFASDGSCGQRAHSPGMSVNEPDDEMLRLIVDLKAERDELKRDVEGWRHRVGDLEKQIGVFAKRVENERREAWVARSRVGLLEVEKNGLEKSLSAKTIEVEEALEGCDKLRAEIHSLREEHASLQEEFGLLKRAAARSVDLEKECSDLKAQLEEERRHREELERELEKANLLATPTPRSFETCVKPGLSRRRGLGFASIDSESSMTDVESDERPYSFPLKAVQEADEEDCFSEEDNGLAGYEDEEDSDISFQSPGGSSLGSEDEFPTRSLNHLRPNVPTSPFSANSTPGSNSNSGSCTPTFSRSNSPTTIAAPQPIHGRRASLSKTWTFPATPRDSPDRAMVEDVDRFFGCLEERVQSPVADTDYSYERSKSLFSQGLQNDDDDMPPFLLPSDIGFVVGSLLPPSQLGVLLEEEEGEEDYEQDNSVDEEIFGEIGGITITFTPAEDDVEESNDSFSEGESLIHTQPPKFFQEEEESDTSMSSESGPTTPEHVQTPRKSMAPSGIPRPKSPSSVQIVSSPSIPSPSQNTKAAFSANEFMSMSSPSRITPPKYTFAGSVRTNAFVTPPTKRGGVMPSQSVASPSPVRSNLPVKAKPAAPIATFTRQPVRRPLSVANQADTPATISPLNGGIENECRPMNVRPHCSFSSSVPTFTKAVHTTPSEVLKGLDSRSSSNTSPHSQSQANPSTSSSNASRLSFFMFTSLNPFSWSKGPSLATTPSIDPCATPRSNESTDRSNKPISRGYVSRELQLEKLRQRLGSESGDPNTCKTCSGEIVFL
ncbi:hypothetical protein PTI98_004981 [Pleurotus ostreatus]|nr:hypothetical protein PTI98_004981 [Pleurotus ostreatus]